ncbi:hypothetical protein, partial [Nostoc sp.]|uniref:hypothetical protein n=1 Tax=Nostoc sp. TaxID=1180 RepID=UPI002FF77586
MTLADSLTLLYETLRERYRRRTCVFDRGATKFEVLQHDFGVPQHDFGVPQNDFGVPQNDFGVPQNDFGVP